MKVNRSLVISLSLMLLISALYRVMPNRPWGFAPQWAIAVFSGGLFVNNKKWAFIIPVISMFISDLLYQLLYINGLTVIPGFYSGQWLNYVLFAGVAFCGFIFNTKKVSGILAASVAAPTIYFFVSNFIVWAGGGGLHRPKTFAGLLTCLGDGLPFYKNSIIATVIFSAVLFGTYYLAENNISKKQVA